MLIKISMIDIFFPLEYGNIKKASVRAKPKWIALAGKPLNIPILNQKGKGDAYQSWNKDQIIAIAATILRWKPVRFLVGDKSSWILVLIFKLFLIIEDIYNTTKKKAQQIYWAFLI